MFVLSGIAKNSFRKFAPVSFSAVSSFEGYVRIVLPDRVDRVSMIMGAVAMEKHTNYGQEN